MIITGKATIFAILLVITTLFGAQLLHEGEYENIEYKVYLDEFTKVGDIIKGQIRVVITNNRELSISMTQISVNLYDPEVDIPFLSIYDEGTTILSGDEKIFLLPFACSYSDIPNNNLQISLIAFISWDSYYGQWIEENIVVPIELEV